MKILSWNVQNGIDAYGCKKLTEQYQYLLKQDADIIALQEVDGIYMAGLEKDLSEYQWHFAPALTFYENGQCKFFGNAIGAKKGTIIQWRAHCLLPVKTDAPQHMCRSVGEIVVDTGNGPLRVVTCHLEFYCAKQREHQLHQIDDIIEAATILQASPSGAKEGLYKPLALPVNSIICGDFNFPDTSKEYQLFFMEQKVWRDLASTSTQPTCGIFDTQQWENGADRRDYFFTNSNTTTGIVEVDTLSSLSDHQPIFLQLGVL
jgi:endonuclease/exonuclease/phosphatase family metal-dependent hydrolase